MYIKSNTENNYDGQAQIKINNVTVFDQNMRWTIVDNQRFVNKLYFHT